MNSRHEITHDMYINDYFFLLFDLTPDRSASEGHTSQRISGNIRVDLKFIKPLPEFYLEFDNSVRMDYTRKVSTDF